MTTVAEPDPRNGFTLFSLRDQRTYKAITVSSFLLSGWHVVQFLYKTAGGTSDLVLGNLIPAVSALGLTLLLDFTAWFLLELDVKRIQAIRPALWYRRGAYVILVASFVINAYAGWLWCVAPAVFGFLVLARRADVIGSMPTGTDRPSALIRLRARWGRRRAARQMTQLRLPGKEHRAARRQVHVALASGMLPADTAIAAAVDSLDQVDPLVRVALVALLGGTIPKAKETALQKAARERSETQVRNGSRNGSQNGFASGDGKVLPRPLATVENAIAWAKTLPDLQERGLLAKVQNHFRCNRSHAGTLRDAIVEQMELRSEDSPKIIVANGSGTKGGA